MENKKIIYVLSILIMLLVFAASLIGVLSNEIHVHPNVITAFDEEIELYQKGLYHRDSVSMATQAIAQDIVTLIIGIPMALISLFLINKENKKGIFLLTGIIGYFLYTYTSYSFLAFFNSFYLVYLAIMALSFYDFILCICELNRYRLKDEFSDKFPQKGLSIFLYITGIVIGLIWLGRIIPAIINNSAPVGLEHYSTLAIQTLDLGVVVPACFVTGYLLRKGKQMGYLFSIVLVIKAVTMTAAVSAMAISMKLHAVEVSCVEFVVFPTIFCICTFFMIRILRQVQ
ncbi:MAG TPA: hypothetical protein DG753_00520 [Clostridium sp.]|nr:hypothetical protein [Clostridium sp.]